jgi:predicted nucleotidyltransferase
MKAVPLLSDERVALADRAATMLHGAGAQRVWLFGSLARRRPQDPRSDIDLAVEGMDPERVRRFASGLGAALRCRVDVVAIETAPPNLRAAIARTGLLMAPSFSGAGERPPTPWFAVSGSDAGRSLFLQRLDAVIDALKEAGAKRVIDLGCGKGWLVELLARDPSFDRIAGVDLSDEALGEARDRLTRVLDRAQMGRVRLFEGLVTHRDRRLLGYDAAVAMEVIEHLDPPRLEAFEGVVFGFMRPAIGVITTPNAEYNVKWRLPAGERLRHPEHRFELSRSEFEEKMIALATRTGYTVTFCAVGPTDAVVGPPTQMASFTRSS